MERKFTFIPGEFYHIFNRSVEKRPIFLDEKDRERFLALLFLANGKTKIVFSRIRGSPFQVARGESYVSVIGYSLMPNHFHIIAQEKEEGGLSTFVGKLSTSYSMYFNTKYERSGPLLCHPFRARHVGTDEYLRWLISYVHLNPLDIAEPGWKERKFLNVDTAANFVKTYPYSSYNDYFGGSHPKSIILERAAVPFETAALEDVSNMLEVYRSGTWDGSDIA